jgi:hypothetical protein
MFQPWKLLENGKPMPGLLPAVEMGVMAYQAFIESHRSLEDDGITVVPYDESVRRFINGVLSAGGGHKELTDLIERGVMERADLDMWSDVVAERFEKSEAREY